MRHLERARAYLPYIDIIGGHHRGEVDGELRRKIILAEIGGAA